MFPEGRALEFLIVAVVALVVVGPKDLPVLLRTLGKFMAKVRGMAAEFRASFDEMARQSELDELRKEVEEMRKSQMADIESHSAFADINQGLSDVGVDLNQGYSYVAPETTIEAAPAKTAKPRARKPATAKATAAKAPAKTAAAKPAARKAGAPAKPAAPKATPVKVAAKSRARKTTAST